ncbi:MAG: Na/Pi cotransporter family protein [Firmicutes bacterium]|nr:Na/Pi cotransporter family protein [Bacillota bacterium]
MRHIPLSLAAALAGLGLILWGIRILNTILGRRTSRRFNILARLTQNPVRSFLTGLGATTLLQSSSLVTVLAVALANAGLTGLRSSIGVVLGANLGTTATAQLAGLKISSVGVPILALGSVCRILGRRTRREAEGYALVRSGSLMIGMGLLMTGFLVLDVGASLAGPAFRKLLAESLGARGSWGWFAAGTVFTAVVQSSSVITVVLVSMASTGLIAAGQALPLMLGANVGTCVTALAASAAGGPAGKRVAAANLVVNLAGALPVMAVLPWFESIVTILSDDPGRRVAHAHTLFNLFTAVMFLPLAGVLARILTLAVPGTSAASAGAARRGWVSRQG